MAKWYYIPFTASPKREKHKVMPFLIEEQIQNPTLEVTSDFVHRK